MIEPVKVDCFVSDVLGAELPSLVLYYDNDTEKEHEKIKTILEPLLKDRPKLQVFEMNIDSEENKNFASNFGLEKTPLLVFYKDWNFHRYKDKRFTGKEIEKFLGGAKFYQEKQENKKSKKI